MPTTSMSPSLDNQAQSAKMQQMEIDIQQTVTQLDKGPIDVVAQLEGFKSELAEVEKIENEQEKNNRLDILQARLGTQLRNEVRQEEKSLAKVVTMLEAYLKEMGMAYTDLERFNTEEEHLIARAQKILEDAKTALEEAHNAWFFKAERIRKAESFIAEAEAAIVRARQEAEEMRRVRLSNYSMKESLQLFLLRVEQTLEMMVRRQEDINQQVQKVQASLDTAIADRSKNGTLLEQKESEIAALQGEIDTQKEMLRGEINGTPRFNEIDGQLKQMESQLETLKGERATLFSDFQTAEKFSQELDVHLKSQKKLQANQRTWVNLLRNSTKYRVTTFQSRLSAMQDSANQEIARKLTDLGNQQDEENTLAMAKIGQAADQNTLEVMKGHPKRLKMFEEMKSAQEEASYLVNREQQALIAEMRELYGIDITQTFSEESVIDDKV